VGLDGQPLALEARHISKRFGGTLALDRAGISLRRGEVHGLLGENGSGKSTLIKVLAGYHAPDGGGTLEVAGRRVSLPLGPGEPRALGLRFVHQDLGLILSLTVLENLRLEQLAAARWTRIAWRAERRRAAATLARLGVERDPRAVVSELRPVERALLAIVRALEDMPAGGVLVLDEPTAFLPVRQREALLTLVRRVAGEGSSVLFVSHDLGEAERLADRATVLRDGRNVGTLAGDELETDRLVELMVGRPLAPPSTPRGGNGRARFSVVRLSGEVVRDLSLDLPRGQVVGITGLPGSGFEELPYLLFGARRARSGRLALDDEIDLTTLTPARALAAGIALLPADRSRDGAVGSLSVGANVTLPALDLYAGRTRLDRRRLRDGAAVLLAEQDVRPPDPGLAFEALSGGNQQKALLAKWLQTHPRLLLLDDPTRGVDVCARERILAALRQTAGAGAAVLCSSSDHEQLADLCGRVLVFSDGRVVEELAGPELTKEGIARRCHSLSA